MKKRQPNEKKRASALNPRREKIEYVAGRENRRYKVSGTGCVTEWADRLIRLDHGLWAVVKE